VNRVAIVAICWFVFWTAVGSGIGRLLDTPGTYTVAGFVFALVTVFAWPFILPHRLQDWMED